MTKTMVVRQMIEDGLKMTFLSLITLLCTEIPHDERSLNGKIDHYVKFLKSKLKLKLNANV